jgi:hypothetical protein
VILKIGEKEKWSQTCLIRYSKSFLACSYSFYLLFSLSHAALKAMLFKLWLVGLIATSAICQDVKEKGNLDDLIDNVFTQGRNEGEAAKVSVELSANFLILLTKSFCSPATVDLVNA